MDREDQNKEMDNMENKTTVLESPAIVEMLKLLEDFWEFQRISVEEDEETGIVTIQSRRRAHFDAYGKPNKPTDWFQVGDELYLTLYPQELPVMERAWDVCDNSSREWPRIVAEKNNIVTYLENRTLKPIVQYLLSKGFNYVTSKWDDAHDAQENPEITLYLGVIARGGMIRGLTLTLGAVDVR
jgi:hypothetical protein